MKSYVVLYSKHTKNKGSGFPVSRRDATHQILSGREKLFPARESLVSDIPAGDGTTNNLFLQCSHL